MASIYINDYSGGLNTRDAKHKILDNQATALENFVVSSDGNLVKRKGSTKYNSSAISSHPVHSLFRYYKSASSFQEMLSVANSTLYKGNDGTGVWTSIAGITVNDHMDFTTWEDICYMFNGTDKKQYDGTTLSNIAGSPPAARYAILHKDRLYVAGIDAEPNRLYFCDTNDATTWNASDFIRIDSDDGDKITGLSVLLGAIIIFKQNSIFVLQGTDSTTFNLKRMVNYTGCIAPRTIASYGNWIYYVGNDGIYRFNGNQSQQISGFIKPDADAMDKTYIENAVSVISDNKYWVSHTTNGDTTNKTVLVFDIISSSWTKFTGLEIASLAIWNSSPDNWEIYGGSSAADGFVYKMNDGTDDLGNDISCSFESKNFDIDVPELFKQIKQIILLAKPFATVVTFTILGDNSRVTRRIDIDITGSLSLWDTALWDVDNWSSADIEVHHIETQEFDARSFRIKIEESSSVGLEITGSGIVFIVRPDPFKELE